MRRKNLVLCFLALFVAWQAFADEPPLRTGGAEKEALRLSIWCQAAVKGQSRDGANGIAECTVRPTCPLVIGYAIRNDGPEPCFLAWSDVTVIPYDFTIRNGQGRRVTSAIKANRAGRHGALIIIPPGAEISFRADLLELFPPTGMAGIERPTLYEAGIYTVSMHLRCVAPRDPSKGRELWVGSLNSNVIKIRIQVLSEEMRTALWTDYNRASPRAKPRLAWLLASNTSGKWDPRLSRLLDAKDPSVRTIGTIAIANGCDAPEEYVPKLETLLQRDESSMVRAYAAVALGKLESTRSVPILIEHVRDRREESYRAAIRALGWIKDKRALPVLRDVAENDPEGWVREAANESIRAIQQSQEQRE